MILSVSAQMFLVILAGWWARRRGYLTAESTSALGRLVIDVTFPALIFTQVLQTMDRTLLLGQWYVPLLGALFLVVGQGVGTLVAPWVAPGVQRPTVIFLVSLSNWTFLPLPIAQALFGQPGTQAVLLMNVGAQAVLWTLCVWRLGRHAAVRTPTLQLALNPGLLATGASLALVFLQVPAQPIVQSVPFQAMDRVGALTVGLSMLVTGGQLAGAVDRGLRVSKPLLGVLLGRLVLTPALMLPLLWLAQHQGMAMARVPVHVAALVAAMPVAVSCGAFCERYGGDPDLATQTVFTSTLLGLATVPLWDQVFVACGL